MGRKKKSGKTKTVDSFDPRKVTEPSIALFQLHDSCQRLNPNEITSRLNAVTASLGREGGWLHPIDTEVIWLILGYLCDQNISDDDLQQMAKVIENRKMYHQFGLCCTNIIQMRNLEDSERKLKLELVLGALCKTTTLYLTIATNAGNIIRPNFFLDLYNTAQSPTIQALTIKPRIVRRLELLHWMLTGNEPQHDSGVEVQDVNSQEERIKESETENLFSAEPPDDIVDWNIVPTHENIFWSGQVFLRPNFIRRPYPDLETYRDVQFRLLMEDFMQPFREGMNKLVNGQIGPKGIPELRIYKKVVLRFFNNPRYVPERESSWRFYKVQFQKIAGVNWTTSRRLIHGSLVCLWDGRNEFIIASVANSQPEDLACGHAILAIETQNLSINFMEKEYLMLESAVFFEPYRAVLQVLQNFSYETFPMIEYFLGFEKEKLPPLYLEKLPSYTLRDSNGKASTIWNLMEFGAWPDGEKLGLDKRQHEALYSALTSRVALVQGPPGTGKTFLALRILRTLLDNKHLWQGKAGDTQELLNKLDSTYGDNWHLKNKIFWKKYGGSWRDTRTPVVVICFTNHALDQFLEGMLEHTKNIIRIGGQSKSAHLENLNLNQFKYRAKVEHNNGPYTGSGYFHYFYRMKQVRARMEVLFESLLYKLRNSQSDILKVSELKRRGVISEEICEVFENAERLHVKRKRKENILKWWLGWSNHRQLLKVLRETRLDLRRSQVTHVSGPTEIKDDKADEYMSEDVEVPYRTGDDMIEDIDDEDYREELRLAQEQAEIEVSPGDVVDDNDEVQLLLDVAENDEEQTLIDFAKNQMERMNLIRDLLLAMTNEPGCVSANEILTLPLSQRWMLFAQWKRAYQEIIQQDLIDTEKEYEDKIAEYNELKGQALAALCRTADIIGMTTTGAAKNRLLLESLKAKIVIVEEAAEVLESHIVCSLTPDCQQLIMIGDHQQLRPSVNVHHLATKYHLDVSLFERLIMGGMSAVRLGVQHRMRPEVARLIVPAVYSQLENHSSVYSHPCIPGMQHNVFFYHHEHQEKEDGNSFYNVHEVFMSLHLALYLVREQGVSPHRITILATYTAQLHQLLNAKRQGGWSNINQVRMTVVDNFQGEENDVIILSLVRNNSRNSVGFLRTDNRICVALSRARNGLYIMGNMHMLAKASPLWNHMEQVLIEHGEIGKEFPLQCNNHRQVLRLVKEPQDFPLKPFCGEFCGTPIACGHGCMRVCHKETVPHIHTCNILVTRRLPCGHDVKMKCSSNIQTEKCNVLVLITKDSCMHEFQVPCSLNVRNRSSVPCPVLVSKELPCGHIQQVPCYVAPDSLTCKANVKFQLPCSHFANVSCHLPLIQRNATLCAEFVRKQLLCGHEKWMKCRENPAEMDCGLMTECVLKCGHLYSYVCLGRSVKGVNFLCEAMVNRHLPCGHVQKITCSLPAERCIQEVNRVLECGHSVKTPCWNTSPRCLTETEKMLMCGHMQLVTCCLGIDLVVCKELVEVLHPLCSHLQLIPCPLAKNEIEMRGWKCKAAPLKTLNCGHEMRLLCTQEIDDTIVCTTMINFELPCHHMVTVECCAREERSKERCKILCKVPTECGHYCSLICHDDKIPHNCQQIVKKQLGCGHFKDLSCYRSSTAENCFEPVSMQRACGHVWKTTCWEVSSFEVSVCPEKTKKQLPCGHWARMKCSESIEKMVCQEPVDFILGCRHTVPSICGDSLDKRLMLTCTVSEMITLPCGHLYRLHCGSKESEKPLDKIFCRKIVEKENKCGHKIKAECGKNLSKKDCTSMCEKILDCGHQCQLRCQESCTTMSCTQKVELNGVFFSCGHPLKGECNLRYADREVIEAKKLELGQCHSRCPEELVCGHRCSSYCNECANNQFHSVCTQPCKNLLICGHKCEAKCGKVCPPCKKQCGYQCSHQMCSKTCGDDCRPCGKMCEWKCPHFQCNHLCYEYCQREPCNEPCPKKLFCGHPCNGLCGEICSPQCPSCARVKMPRTDDETRYIYLECKHWIPVEEMDEWVYQGDSEETIARIQCPSCPKCKQAIKLCFRYGDRIKAFYMDLISVKWDFFNGDAIKQEKVRRALTKWKPETGSSLSRTDEITRLESIYLRLQSEANRHLHKEQRWDILCRIQLTYLLSCLANDATKKYVTNKNGSRLEFTLPDTAVERILYRVSIASNFMEKHAYSGGHGYYADLFSKIKHFELIRQYSVVETLSAKFPEPSDRKQLERFNQLLLGNRKWSDDEEGHFVDWLRGKSNFFKVSLSSSVKSDVNFIQRLDMNGENWFKCTKPYCEAVFSIKRHHRCPECLDQSDSY